MGSVRAVLHPHGGPNRTSVPPPPWPVHTVHPVAGTLPSPSGTHPSEVLRPPLPHPVSRRLRGPYCRLGTVSIRPSDRSPSPSQRERPADPADGVPTPCPPHGTAGR